MRAHPSRGTSGNRRRILAALSVTLLCSTGVTALPAAARSADAPAADRAATATGRAPAIPGVPRVPDGLALTPPMGFNNWNSTHCRAEFNEAMIKSIADIMVDKGLKAAGYEYVNLDDCWASPKRDANGKLVPHPQRFPNGIKAVADYVHSKGLKFGIYTSAGTRTCDSTGLPGALGHEFSDARQFAEWGVDYLKYDNCNNEGVDAKKRYTTMRDALRATGRPIVYSICEWGENKPWEWAGDLGHLWRTTWDIKDKWQALLPILKKNLKLAKYAGPGRWNDPDMLEVGNGGMTDTEYRTHFSLWAMMAAPLLIGTDLRKATPQTYEILGNREVIALDQDPLGKQGTVVKSGGSRWTVVKRLANGDRAVALFNEADHPQRITTTAKDVGLPKAGGYRLRDVWKHRDFHSAGTISATVPAHGTVVFRVSPSKRWAAFPPAIEAGTDRAVLVEEGDSHDVKTTVGNLGRTPAQDVRTRFDAPEGWRVEARSPATARVLPGGRTLRTSWRITPPEDAAPGSYELTLTTTYRAPDGEPITQTLPVPSPIVVPPPDGTPYASDLPFVYTDNYLGPVERDASVGGAKAGDGVPLSIGGVRYAKGLGTHATSEVRFYTGEQCSVFRAQVGVDDETGTQGSVAFEVWADGRQVAQSPRLTGADGPASLTADIEDAREVRLVTTMGEDNYAFDHSDWGDARFEC
ncbi:NPCBM/NEW2 domain-containing protein [Streptomyces sp. NPDC003077]|uniref:NPCBM/NEW2 domain-containing protein n=1 Tax=Streptomyces sp. NPDC003077 TaxID=3154443 RepID=UPI0033A5FD3C